MALRTPLSGHGAAPDGQGRVRGNAVAMPDDGATRRREGGQRWVSIWSCFGPARARGRRGGANQVMVCVCGPPPIGVGASV